MPLIVSPRNVMRPALQRIRPTIRFNKVDLPQPDGPTMVTNSPSAMSKSMESRATIFLPRTKYSFLTPSTASSDMKFLGFAGRIEIDQDRNCGAAHLHGCAPAQTQNQHPHQSGSHRTPLSG